MELHRQATGGVFIPYMNGPQVDHHPAALTYLARKELKEAKEHIKEIDFSKPLGVMEDFELQHIEETVHELLDVSSTSCVNMAELRVAERTASMQHLLHVIMS
ncbi:hypothetical protein [Halalkalibacterium ligniniphilum]|uniref:hypothetical protein n=1 Tax=Halalkalibacterium ligniniphilum TaxID=1134413 RepID=UPI00034D3BDC|nr:hypothetical protein [Halalkalibacterium ligniniphilum]